MPRKSLDIPISTGVSQSSIKSIVIDLNVSEISNFCAIIEIDSPSCNYVSRAKNKLCLIKRKR